MMILIIAAVFPALLILGYIYRLDTIEKEPKKLVRKVFLMGALSVVPTIVVELLLEKLTTGIIRQDTSLYLLVDNFLCVALVEEFWKRWAARRAVWNNPEFNYRFDAIVYCVSSALGFAALENIFYVMDEGLGLAGVRAVTSIPTHAINGVIMGHFFGLAKEAENAGDPAGKRRYLFLSLFFPMIEHGFYDWAITKGTDLSVTLWFAVVILVDLWAFSFVKKASRRDCPI